MHDIRKLNVMEGILDANDHIAEHINDKGALMPVLQKAQEIYGYLPIEVQTMIAEEMNIPLEKVYGVATFYAQFSLNPKGKRKSKGNINVRIEALSLPYRELTAFYRSLKNSVKVKVRNIDCPSLFLKENSYIIQSRHLPHIYLRHSLYIFRDSWALQSPHEPSCFLLQRNPLKREYPCGPRGEFPHSFSACWHRRLDRFRTP